MFDEKPFLGIRMLIGYDDFEEFRFCIFSEKKKNLIFGEIRR